MLYGRGSLTVEAAFCGTLFFLALFSLLFLFQIVERYNSVQMQLSSVAHQYECYGIKRRAFQDKQKNSYLVGWNEEKGTCFVRRREEIPYFGKNFFHISWYQQMRINGYKGKSMVSPRDENGEYVYLASHGKVYHRKESCVYLKPGIQEVVFRQVADKRNISGGRYSPCGSCGKHARPAEDRKVYITPYGDSWHVYRGCSRINRTVRRVRLKEVGGLPPCSKCG